MLLTFIKLPFSIKIFVLSIFKRPLKIKFLPSFSCYHSRVPAGNLSISSVDPAGSRIYTSPENEDPVTIYV